MYLDKVMLCACVLLLLLLVADVARHGSEEHFDFDFRGWWSLGSHSPFLVAVDGRLDSTQRKGCRCWTRVQPLTGGAIIDLRPLGCSCWSPAAQNDTSNPMRGCRDVRRCK